MVSHDLTTSLSIWDDEGGAAPAASLEGRPSFGRAVHQSQLLERLGLALMAEWHHLPAEIQKAIFNHAASSRSPEGRPLRSEIAKLLHNKKMAGKHHPYIAEAAEVGPS